jgi:hypothetical protein
MKDLEITFPQFLGNLFVGRRSALGGFVPPSPSGHQIRLTPARLGDADRGGRLADAAQARNGLLAAFKNH